MSHGVHAVQHEVEHQIEHESMHGGGHDGGKPAVNQNKKIALLIAVMALFLAFSETLGKSAQTAALELQRRGLESLGFLPGKDDPADHVRTAAESDEDRGATATDEPSRRR